jgi:hypothetical protein
MKRCALNRDEWQLAALTPRIIERIFSGAVTRDRHASQSRTAVSSITYPDFVAFLLAEEDKKHPTRSPLPPLAKLQMRNISSIEYWFRCLDLDGDGFISLYEMEYFYADVQRKMEAYGIDTMKFEDVACNVRRFSSISLVHVGIVSVVGYGRSTNTESRLTRGFETLRDEYPILQRVRQLE